MIQIGVDFRGRRSKWPRSIALARFLREFAHPIPAFTIVVRAARLLGNLDFRSGLERDYYQIYGAVRSGEDIISLMRAGDANATLGRYLDRLGRGLATVCNIIEPDVIVLGGGLSNVSEIYIALPAIIVSYVFSDSWSAKIAPAPWGDSSGVRGAARLLAAQI
jgi:predicted NBD/HSP70 family sugar kinase